MEVRINTLTPGLFLDLYKSVGWEAPGIKQVEAALKNTFVTFTAYEGSHAVGMARLIGDGGLSFYIKDFAVIPAFQSKGAGTALIERIETYIRGNIDASWACQPGKGFEERPSAGDGPGMFKIIR